MRRIALIALWLAVLMTTAATAHEMRPAYLALQETADRAFTVLWKVPALGEQRLALYARLPEDCNSTSEPLPSIDAGAYTERWTVSCSSSLRGRRITIDGLQATLTDVLARISYLDGSVEIARMTPESPSFVVAGAQSGFEVARTYFTLGVDHILSGLDHLLFVFALILLIRDRWMLVKTITAFTVAHSITLAGASLGYFTLPQKPVEAAVALSIAFIAAELARKPTAAPRTSERYPWIIAFCFGLLHGFGFAGALKETGLPQTDVPVALLTFNLGVEAGQLLFVVVVLVVFRAIGFVFSRKVALARPVAAYAIGTVAMLWLFARLSSFGA